MNIQPCRLHLSAPSTSANLGPGYDCLGLALQQRNSWTVTLLPGPEPGRCEVVKSKGGGSLEPIPTDRRHLFFSSWDALHREGFGPDLFALLKTAGLQVELEADNATPIARGLGSSAAVRVAGAEVYRRLTGSTEREAWELASHLEGHPDNSGPAGLGGLFLGIQDQQGRYRALQLPIHSCWKIVVVVPDFALHTERARAVLKTDVTRKDAIFNLGRLAFLLHGLKTGDTDQVRLGCEDRLHQNQRSSLIPGFFDVLQAAREHGASAAYLSGAGPTIAAFVDSRKGPEQEQAIAAAMQAAFALHGIESRAQVKGVDEDGLRVKELEQQIA